MSATDTFWAEIDAQLKRIRDERPDTFDKVAAILISADYPAVLAYSEGNPHVFFAGGGGVIGVEFASALYAAGWRVTAWEAYYYYAMRHPVTGEALTYIEGDVLKGDSLSAEVAKAEDIEEAREAATSGYYDAETGETITDDAEEAYNLRHADETEVGGE